MINYLIKYNFNKQLILIYGTGSLFNTIVEIIAGVPAKIIKQGINRDRRGPHNFK